MKTLIAIMCVGLSLYQSLAETRTGCEKEQVLQCPDNTAPKIVCTSPASECGASAQSPAPAVEVCNAVPMDVCFILDDSFSIPPASFVLMKQFVVAIIDSFDIGPDRTRVAAVSFSIASQIEFDFTKYNNPDSLKQAVLAIEQRSGFGTNTHKALDDIDNVLSGDMRSGVHQVVVLITDGASSYQRSTVEAADRVKAKGITIITLGVGMSPSSSSMRQEVEAISSSSEHVFDASFSALDSVKEKLTRTVCTVDTNNIK